jgi:hypothetical protein
MAYKRGAFKVHCCIALNSLSQVAAPKYQCRKFSQSVIVAQKMNSLPLRHTFLSPICWADQGAIGVKFLNPSIALRRSEPMAWFLRFP